MMPVYTLPANHRLTAFEKPVVTRNRDGLLRRLLAASQIVFLGLGALLLVVEISPDKGSPTAQPHRISVQLKQRRPEPALLPVVAEPEPVLLTPETVLDQVVDRPVPPPESAVRAVPATAAVEVAVPEPAPRRVYGVRRVMAHGLGRGASAGGNLVVKRGNTVDGVADQLVATEADLQGSLAPLSTVEKAPEPLERVKPRYSRALVQARAAGKVTARLLIDIDGSVQAVEIIEDIGHDSRDVAAEAFRQFRFRPALRRGQPVAVWILHHIRFEFQE